MQTDEDGLGAEIAKKTAPPPFDRIPSKTAARSSAHRVVSDTMITMRDGVRLATDVYLPEGDGPFPTILTRMPYGKTEPYCFIPLIGAFFASKGYAYVAQDVRGKWGSEGSFDPNVGGTEIHDGYDTISWIVAQEWSKHEGGHVGRILLWVSPPTPVPLAATPRWWPSLQAT